MQSRNRSSNILCVRKEAAGVPSAPVVPPPTVAQTTEPDEDDQEARSWPMFSGSFFFWRQGESGKVALTDNAVMFKG